MELTILKQEKDKVHFVLGGINYIVANTLRRLIVEEVPSLAIEEVTFIKNNSVLYDEVIAHRLGLIPLKADLKSYNMPSECKCKDKGCSMCQIHFKLDVKGPATVYSEDLKFTEPKVLAAYPKMPIAKLLKGQRLEIEGIAILGNGKIHTKFTPGLLYYHGYPEINIKNCKGTGKCITACPKNILKMDGNKVKTQNILDCHLCKACEDVCPENAIKVYGNPNKVIFHLESFGQISPKEMLLSALDILDEKIDAFESEVKRLKI